MVADPGLYRWSSYRHNGLGQADERLSRHAKYRALGASDQDRLARYRSLFRSQLDEEALSDSRLALSQGQPLGNNRFREAQCKAAGIRQTEARRGRPTKSIGDAIGIDGEQSGFGF